MGPVKHVFQIKRTRGELRHLVSPFLHWLAVPFLRWKYHTFFKKLSTERLQSSVKRSFSCLVGLWKNHGGQTCGTSLRWTAERKKRKRGRKWHYDPQLPDCCCAQSMRRSKAIICKLKKACCPNPIDQSSCTWLISCVCTSPVSPTCVYYLRSCALTTRPRLVSRQTLGVLPRLLHLPVCWSFTSILTSLHSGLNATTRFVIDLRARDQLIVQSARCVSEPFRYYIPAADVGVTQAPRTLGLLQTFRRCGQSSSKASHKRRLSCAIYQSRKIGTAHFLDI